jgi:hypothetical protein
MVPAYQDRRDQPIVRLLFPAASVGIAVWVGQKGWGLFNTVTVPYWAAVLLSALALDFVIYLQHVMFHAVPAFWRLHMMHHADLDFDVTTGNRFHPVVNPLYVIKTAAVLCSVRLRWGYHVRSPPERGDVQSRECSASPRARRDSAAARGNADMPGSSFSVPIETNSNFGFNFRGGTGQWGLSAQPSKAEGMTIGLNQFATLAAYLPQILIMPFVGPRAIPINRRGGDQAVLEARAGSAGRARVVTNVAEIAIIGAYIGPVSGISPDEGRLKPV